MSYYYESNDGHFFLKNKNGKIKSISKELFLKKKLNHSGGELKAIFRRALNPVKNLGQRLLSSFSKKDVPIPTTGSMTGSTTGSNVSAKYNIPNTSTNPFPTTNPPSNKKKLIQNFLN